MLFRLFPYSADTGPREDGGALYVPRALQGRGRHDNPDRYGALYASRSEVSVVAEFLWQRGFRELAVHDLLAESGRPYAVAALDDAALPALVDLDDPVVLSRRSLRPSTVATRDREPTQAQALAAYEEGTPGIEWWSTIEASWINVTLFADRAVPRLALAGDPEPLALDRPALREAAEAVGVLVR